MLPFVREHGPLLSKLGQPLAGLIEDDEREDVGRVEGRRARESQFGLLEQPEDGDACLHARDHAIDRDV